MYWMGQNELANIMDIGHYIWASDDMKHNIELYNESKKIK